MSNITICFSTHRPENLGLTARIMQGHDVIILEEPPHADFAEVLSGDVPLDEHLLELDVGYPLFTLAQYRLLQEFYRAEKTNILQIEPYLEHLLRIQYFFAENHRPDEIKPATIGHAVYCAERNATGMLLAYYNEVRGDNFARILTTMNSFAKADAARFILRDSLRAKGIMEVLVPGKNIYIEAGSIHLLLFKLLAKSLSQEWSLHMHSVDREAMNILGYRGSFFGPGDKLTLYYIYGRTVSRDQWTLLCAQALIYSKVVRKEETRSSDASFPHARNEHESITAVNQLSIENCRILFQQIRTLSSEEAAEALKKYCHNRG